MNASFSAAKLKVDRAKKHISEFEESVSAFVATEPFRFSTTVEGYPGQQIVTMGMQSDPVPECWGAIVGDAIHNMRTALDLAACESVRAAGASDKRVYFPFCADPNDLDKIIKDRNFHRAKPEVIDFVKSLKPFKGGNASLRAIHDLDLQDKHQALIPNASVIASPVISLWNDEGHPELSVVGSPVRPSELKFIFPDGGVFSQQEIIPTLHELVNLVDSILDALIALHTP